MTYSRTIRGSGDLGHHGHTAATDTRDPRTTSEAPHGSSGAIADRRAAVAVRDAARTLEHRPYVRIMTDLPARRYLAADRPTALAWSRLREPALWSLAVAAVIWLIIILLAEPFGRPWGSGQEAIS